MDDKITVPHDALAIIMGLAQSYRVLIHPKNLPLWKQAEINNAFSACNDALGVKELTASRIPRSSSHAG